MGNNNISEKKYNYKNIYQYIPDINDFRDKFVSLSDSDYSDIVDLRGSFPPIINIEDWNGSIAAGLSSIIYYELVKLDENIFIPSRQFIYYNSLLYNSKTADSFFLHTPSIRQSLKCISKWGVCPEQYLPFNKNKIHEKPENNIYQIASKYSIEYYKVPVNINDLKLVLNNKKSIILALPIYSSFHNDTVRMTGRIPYPESLDINVGALCVVILGYIEDKELFIVRFPFGDLWGDHGYGYISYEYITQMAMDLWTIDIITKSNNFEKAAIQNIMNNNNTTNKGTDNTTNNISIMNRYI